MIEVTNYRVFVVTPQKGVPQVYHPSILLRALHFPSSAYKNVDVDNAVIIFASDKGFGLVAIGKTGIGGNTHST